MVGSTGGRQLRGRRRGTGAVASSAGGRRGWGGRAQAGSVAGRAVGCRPQGCRPAVGRWLAAGAAPAVRATASGAAKSPGRVVSDRSERAKTAATLRWISGIKTSGVGACSGPPKTDPIAPNATRTAIERTSNLQAFSLCAPFRCVDCSLEPCRACKNGRVPVLCYFSRPR